jgi:2-keto-4-pentenoate hydratase
MPITAEVINQIAQTFLETDAKQAAHGRVADIYDGITSAEAYRVQQAVVAGYRRQGRRMIGKKGGATSAAAQASLSVDEPLCGYLFDFHQAPYGQTIATEHFIKPLLECEIAFTMGQTLTGPNVTAADVLAATESVGAAFEIVDFRRTGPIGMPEAICYNVFARRVVFGPNTFPVAGIDLPGVNLVLKKNGQQVATATGQAVLGDPAGSVAWLVNKLAELGASLEAGERVISGALAAPHPIAAGDHFEAIFEPLGPISVQFS